MYTIQKIESTLELPYHLIDINTGREHFIFQFKAFDEHQTDESIKWGGVTGKFSVIYQCQGMNCHFECDVTVGNVYEFYLSLDTAYDILGGHDAVAVLKDYSHKRTNLTIKFDHKGHCFVDGRFKNKNNQYESGIFFSFEVDQTYITDILNSMEVFFKELKRIQGHSKFY